MAIKYNFSLEDIYELACRRGYKYIDGDYSKTKNKITVEDNDGYRYSVMLGRLISDSEFTPYRFREVNPFTLYNIDIFLKSIDSESVILSEEYSKENRGKIKIKCKCGNIFERSLSNIIQRKTCLCKKCTNKRTHDNQRRDIKDIESIFNNKGWYFIHNLTNKDEIGFHDNIDVINKDGFKASISTCRILQSKNPKIMFIHSSNKFSIDNINKILEDENSKVRVISNNYNKNNQNLLWRCLECGHEYERTWATYISCKNKLCPLCLIKNKSYLEYCVNNYLKCNNVKYEREKRFKDCKDKLYLPFDFYIKSKNLIIECDGIQHFEPTMFGDMTIDDAIEKFEIYKYHDKIKEDYCKYNNIKLIRLKFDLFKDESYISILDKELK